MKEYGNELLVQILVIRSDVLNNVEWDDVTIGGSRRLKLIAATANRLDRIHPAISPVYLLRALLLHDPFRFKCPEAALRLAMTRADMAGVLLPYNNDELDELVQWILADKPKLMKLLLRCHRDCRTRGLTASACAFEAAIETYPKV